MSTDEMNKLFMDVIVKWRSAESQRMIFGVDMPQAQRAFEDLSQSFQTVFSSLPSFSLVEKDEKIKIVIKSSNSEGDASETLTIPANIPSLPKIFKEINITSITLSSGVTEEELKEFFRGISMRADNLEQQGGLKGFLQSHGAAHIKVDQMKFQLLSDEEQIVTGKENIKNIIQAGLNVGKKTSAKATKLQNSTWKDYLAGNLGAQDFKDQNQDLIEKISEDPKKLEKILKRMVTSTKLNEDCNEQQKKFLNNCKNNITRMGK